MKNFSNLSLLLSFSILVLFPQAHAATLNLAGIGEQEKNWNLVNATLGDKFSTPIAIYETTQGQARISEIPKDVKVEASIYVDFFKRFDDRKELSERFCDFKPYLFTDFRELKDYKNEIVIKGYANLFNAENKKRGVTVPGFAFGKNLTVENWPTTDLIKPRLEFLNGSRTLAVDALHLEVLNQKISEQIESQLLTIQETGEFTLVLPAYYEVACDLIFGQAELKLDAYTYFEAALLRRTEFLTAQQLEQIHLSAAKINKRAPAARVQFEKIKTGVSLGMALSENISQPEVLSRLIDEKFDTFTEEFVAHENGALKNFESINFKNAARRLEDLHRGTDRDVLPYTQLIRWEK